jgi:protein PhnA
MNLSQELKDRNQGMCELCNTNEATQGYTVSPRSGEKDEDLVAICAVCGENLEKDNEGFYWRCVEGSIWSPEPAVQALSYRILNKYKEEAWAGSLLSGIDMNETIVQWAMSAFEKQELHKDAFGNVLSNGDNVVLTQALNVKGTNFTASKGTVVKRIRLVPDNTDQIEGKINDQTIVILTKFVKKG